MKKCKVHNGQALPVFLKHRARTMMGELESQQDRQKEERLIQWRAVAVACTFLGADIVARRVAPPVESEMQ